MTAWLPVSVLSYIIPLSRYYQFFIKIVSGGRRQFPWLVAESNRENYIFINGRRKQKQRTNNDDDSGDDDVPLQIFPSEASTKPSSQ